MGWETVLKDKLGEFGYPEGDERNEQSRVLNENFGRKAREVLSNVAYSLGRIGDLEVVARKTESGLEIPIGFLFEYLAELLELKADFIEDGLEIEGPTLDSKRTRPSLDEAVKNMREVAKKFRAKS